MEALALLVVLVLGVPHGALDPVLALRAGVPARVIAMIGFHLAYVALAALFFLFWLEQGAIALAVFLAMSVWHFGGDATSGIASLVPRLAYGGWVLALPMVFWAGEVSVLFDMLAGEQASVPVRVLGLVGLLISWPGLFAVPASRRWEWAGLALLAWALPPLWYFVVFFCLLHSPRHLLREFAVLSGAQRRLALVVMALVMSATVLAGVLLPQSVSGFDIAAFEGAFRLIFIGMAALTLPHMILVEVLERRERGTAKTVAY